MNRVYAARLAGMVVLGPDGESIGRVRDVVISISIVRQQPRVLGLVVELLTRRRIFVPMLRVTAIEPSAVTLTTANVSLRRFAQRPGEVLVLGQVIDTRVRVDDPDLPQLAGVDVVVVDLGIEQTRTRDWVVTRVAVRAATPAGPPRHYPHRRLAKRAGPDAVRAGDARPGRGPTAPPVRGPAAHRGRRRPPRAAGQAPLRGGNGARRRTPRRRRCRSCPKTTRSSCSGSWRPNAPPTCWRRWTPTTPPTCWARCAGRRRAAAAADGSRGVRRRAPAARATHPIPRAA